MDDNWDVPPSFSGREYTYVQPPSTNQLERAAAVIGWLLGTDDVHRQGRTRFGKEGNSESGSVLQFGGCGDYSLQGKLSRHSNTLQAIYYPFLVPIAA